MLEISMALKEKIREIEYLRAIGIFIILFHHLPSHSFNFYNIQFSSINFDFTWLNDLNRYFALGIFVFISGYGLMSSNSEISHINDAKKFFLKRFFRIIPLYIIALLLYVQIFKFLISPMNVFSWLAHLTGLQILLASRFCEPIFTLWYVGLIISYYLLFLLLARFGKSFDSIISYGAISVIMSALIMIKFGFIDKRFVLYLPIFLAGIISSKYRLLDSIKLKHLVILFLLFITSSWAYVDHIYPAIKDPLVKPRLFSLTSFSAFVSTNIIMLTFVIILFKGLKYAFISSLNGFVSIISYASYCMFLFHRPIWWLMSQIYISTKAHDQLLYMVLIGIPAIIMISYITQKLYDNYVVRFLEQKFLYT